jgi:hypothetical protein
VIADIVARDEDQFAELAVSYAHDSWRLVKMAYPRGDAARLQTGAQEGDGMRRNVKPT